ncbi:MAG: DUF4157 domain-containing protein [Deltaproteobacteria bacterium]|nr:DUF4157 domain-containing protein [Deltaproteobacteria bacterium]
MSGSRGFAGEHATDNHAGSNRDHAHAPPAIGKQTLVEQLGYGYSHGAAPVITSELPRGPADGGRALPREVLEKMERAFGADLSDVRVHEGDHVTQMRAQAYAHGANLHFAPGQFDPASTGGMELIGHEIAHVIQQRDGRASAPQHNGGVIADASLERQADDLGHRAARNEIVARPGASRSMPAGAAGQIGIQGNLVAGSSYQVMALMGVPAYDEATKAMVTLVGNFLCTKAVGGGFAVMSYKDAKEYLVTTKDASDPLQWVTFVPPKGADEYLPPVGAQQQHPRVENKKSNKQNYDAKGKKVPPKGAAPIAHNLDFFGIPAKRGAQGGMERSEFESVNEKDLLPSTKKYMDPEAKSTGANRELMFNQNETDGMVEDVEHKSLIGGTDTLQGATYCAYCLKWFEGPALDADHVMTWKAIGQWFDAILKKMNDPKGGPTFVAAMRLKFKAQAVEFDKHFIQNPFDTTNPWVASQMGAYYMFNNVKNLALSCKVCNQLEKNDMEWQDHLGKHAFFAKDFLKTLAPGDDEAPVRSDGKYVAESMREFNLKDPDSRRALDSNRTIFSQSVKRTNRNTRSLLAGRNREWDRADALVDKETMLARTLKTLDAEWDSDGEEHASEKRDYIKIGIQDALFFSDENLEYDPREMLRANEDLLDDLDDARADNRRLHRQLEREKTRGRESEREGREHEAEANRLYDENQQLKQDLVQQQLVIQQQQAKMMQMMQTMQQMQQMQQMQAQQPQFGAFAGHPFAQQPPQAPHMPMAFGQHPGPLQPPTWPQPQQQWPQHQQQGPSPKSGPPGMDLDK